MTSADRTFRRHVAQLDTGRADRTLVLGVKKALSNAYRRERGWSCNEGMMSDEQIAAITGRIYQEAPRVDDASEAFGLAYLRKPRNMRKLGHRECRVLDAGMCQIRLVGFREDERSVSRPVYRVESMCTDFEFCYTVTPWQAGGDGLEIVG